jgi:hypothetical protein
MNQYFNTGLYIVPQFLQLKLTVCHENSKWLQLLNVWWLKIVQS